jgi:hypothetical protein
MAYQRYRKAAWEEKSPGLGTLMFQDNANSKAEVP